MIKEPFNGEEWFTTVSKGCVPGHKIIHIFAHNPEILQSTDPEDIWEPGNTLTWQITADTIDIVSTSAADAAAGTGARKVLVEGLDTDFLEITEEVPLDGLTPVITLKTFIRVNNLTVIEVGTYHGSNEGDIIASYTSTTDVASQISIGKGIHYNSHYTVPSAKVGFLYSPLINLEANKIAKITLQTYNNADDLVSPFESTIKILLQFDGISSFAFNFTTPIRIEEKSDIWWVIDDVSASSSIIVDYELLLVDSRLVE